MNTAMADNRAYSEYIYIKSLFMTLADSQYKSDTSYSTKIDSRLKIIDFYLRELQQQV